MEKLLCIALTHNYSMFVCVPEILKEIEDTLFLLSESSRKNGIEN